MSEKTKIHWQSGSDTGYILLTDVIVIDDFRCREKEDADTIESYTEVFKEYNKKPTKEEERLLSRCPDYRGKNTPYPFPPAWVWQENEQYYLIAGFHRFQAATNAKMERLLVKELKGTKEAAIEFAIKDNLKNGLRLSYGDWKHCVSKVLLLSQGKKSAGVVARELGCSRSYVHKIQKELSTSGQLPEVEKRIGADNKERSTKRKTKQPTVTSVEKSASDPVSEQENPTPQDNPAEVSLNLAKGVVVDNENDNTPFGFETTSPATVKENIKPSSPELVKNVDGMCTVFRNKIANFRQRKDRLYILYRLKELVRETEEQLDTNTPQK